MKRILLFILLSAPGLAIAQSDQDVELVPMVDGHIFYSEVDTVAGATKDELYSRAKGFLSTVFPNFSNVVKLDDRDLGEVRVRGIFNTLDKNKKGMVVSYYEFYAIVDIQAKDGRYKYQISEFKQPDTGYSFEIAMYNKKRVAKVSKELAPYMNKFIEGLKSAMRGQLAKDNW